MNIKDYHDRELENTDLYLFMKNCLSEIYANFSGQEIT